MSPGNFPKINKFSKLFLFLSVLLKQGFTLQESLRIYEKEPAVPKRTKVFAGKLAVIIEKGYSFSEALDFFPKVFPSEFREYIKCGETTGNLPAMLERCNILENHTQWKTAGFNYLLYPIILCFICANVFVFISSAVLPSFFYIISSVQISVEDFKGYLETTGMNSLLINLVLFFDNVMNFMFNYPFSGYILLLLFILMFYIIITLLTSKIGKKILYKLNTFFPFYKSYVFSDFTNFTGSLIETGMPFNKAIELYSFHTTSPLKKNAINAEKMLSRGESLIESISKNNLVDGDCISLFSSKNHNDLSSDLLNASNHYYLRYLQEIKKFHSFLEPLLALFLGVFYVIIAASIYTAILKVYASTAYTIS